VQAGQATVKPRSCWLPADRTPRAFRASYDKAIVPFTVGLEEELMLVDSATGRLVACVDDVLAHVDGDERFRAELRATQIELVTRPYLSAEDVGRELATARLDLAGQLGNEIALLGCGTHPTASAPGRITEGDRYRAIARDNPWAARWMLTCGLHVHVAVSGGDRALAVFNALRSFLPELAALGANSPYWGRHHTRIASTRLQLNRSLLRHGVPPAFESWHAYADLVAWGCTSGTMPDPSYHWWDLRLNPGLGTIEVHVADTQTEVGETVAVVALVQTLAAWLGGRFDAGERLPRHDCARIGESLWLGLRVDSPSELADLDTGVREPTTDRISRLVDALEPTAERLGTGDQLARLPALATTRGADRQEAVARERGLDELVGWLTRRTVDSARSYLRHGPPVRPPDRIPDEGAAAVGRVAGPVPAARAR
jgi:glutamate---cysteine ligase / carboxylate-amine ligase